MVKRSPKSSKGLSKEAFDKWWNERWFNTQDKGYALFHEIHRELFTQNRIDVVLLWIISLASRLEAVRKAIPNEPPEKFNKKKLLDAIAVIKNALPSALLPGTEELVRTLDYRAMVKWSLLPYRQYLKSEPKDPGQWIANLQTLDAFSSTKPSICLQSYSHP